MRGNNQLPVNGTLAEVTEKLGKTSLKTPNDEEGDDDELAEVLDDEESDDNESDEEKDLVIKEENEPELTYTYGGMKYPISKR